MSMPTLSRIVPANKAAVGVVEKWRIPDLNKSSSSVVTLVPGPREGAAAIDKSESSGVGGAAEGSQKATEGYAQGYAEGLKIAEAEMKSQLDSVQAMAKVLASPVSCVTEEVTAELLELALDMARSIVKHELQLSPEMLGSFITDAVARLPAASSPVQVSVHPDDLTRLQALKDGVDLNAKGEAPDFTAIDWVTDNSMAAGQFVVSRGNSHVHGGIDEMLKRVCAGALK